MQTQVQLFSHQFRFINTFKCSIWVRHWCKPIIALLFDANILVHLGHRNKQSIQLSTAHDLLYRSSKASPTLYWTNLRITNHRGHKFPTSLAVLQLRIESNGLHCWPNRNFFERNFLTPAVYKATPNIFGSEGCYDEKKTDWTSPAFSLIFFRFRTLILPSLK